MVPLQLHQHLSRHGAQHQEVHLPPLLGHPGEHQGAGVGAAANQTNQARPLLLAFICPAGGGGGCIEVLMSHRFTLKVTLSFEEVHHSGPCQGAGVGLLHTA
jgi:hypothetical protein